MEMHDHSITQSLCNTVLADPWKRRTRRHFWLHQLEQVTVDNEAESQDLSAQTLEHPDAAHDSAEPLAEP